MLNVGSTAGMRPRPGLTWYNASKGAVNLVSKSLAVELAPWQHPRQRALPGNGRDRPAPVDFMGVEDTPENRAKFVATIPLGRLSQPKDIAARRALPRLGRGGVHHRRRVPVDGGRTVCSRRRGQAAPTTRRSGAFRPRAVGRRVRSAGPSGPVTLGRRTDARREHESNPRRR